MFGKGTWGRRLVYATGVAGLVGVGGGYAAYQRRLKENKSITAVEFNAQQNQDDLRAALAQIKKGESSGFKAVLYRYTTCPFCGTAKAMLDFAKIPHECVEVEPMFKREISESTYKKVPQLRFIKTDGSGEGPYLVDSDIIVETLATSVGLEKQVKDEEILKWRSWARGSLVRLITLDFNSSLLAAWKGYSYIDNIDTIPYVNKLFLKLVGAPVMYLVAKNVTAPRLIKNGDIKPGDDPKQALHKEVNRFVEVGLKGAKAGTFHGGKTPDLADLDVYGVLQAVRGHRVYDDIIANTSIKPWLDAMDATLGHPAYKEVKTVAASN